MVSFDGDVDGFVPLSQLAIDSIDNPHQKATTTMKNLNANDKSSPFLYCKKKFMEIWGQEPQARIQ